MNYKPYTMKSEKQEHVTRQTLDEAVEAVLTGMQIMFNELYKYLDKKFEDSSKKHENLEERVIELEKFKRRITAS
ncbi:MAG: hypothetical protein US96_C0001G0003 [Candidatus Woesebacteria bacterium GW2011_GWB1_38_5b]|uniref:Uncharacterized protein n=1 Tax=Candidatus Woesebacteria bacterium GW2011_GWB1_38_5b TaxID=1618569 RepID=A0A0G0KAP7_9BACT|nr:MAG: hypothetical protein US96_C0001G0003 [Candidatus Woesebacteria bacterium GW2011_GWB1_38_5b]